MSKVSRTVFGALVAAGLACAPAMAAGPVDGELGLLWWQNDYERDSALAADSTDSGAPGYRGELWFFERFGVRATQFSSDLEDLGEEDADYLSADVLWRLVSPTENTFFAVGLGYQDTDFAESGLLVETSGYRASVEGRVGLVSVARLYGQYIHLLGMDDASPGTSGDAYTDLEGSEYELGVAWDVAPFVDMRAGYRATELDFTRVPTAGGPYSGTVDSSGFMVGFGIHF